MQGKSDWVCHLVLPAELLVLSHLFERGKRKTLAMLHCALSANPDVWDCAYEGASGFVQSL